MAETNSQVATPSASPPPSPEASLAATPPTEAEAEVKPTEPKTGDAKPADTKPPERGAPASSTALEHVPSKSSSPKKAKQKPPSALSEQLKEAKELVNDIPEILSDLKSPDQPTRMMSWLFVLSLTGFLAVAGFGLKRIWNSKTKQYTQRKELEKHIEDLDKKVKLTAQDYEKSWVKLGTFKVDLREISYPGEIRRAVGVGLVEVSLRCDSPSTAEYITEHAIQAEDQAAKAFIAINRDELLTAEGKNKLKIMLTKILNDWLPTGRIDELYFSKLVVN